MEPSFVRNPLLSEGHAAAAQAHAPGSSLSRLIARSPEQRGTRPAGGAYPSGQSQAQVFRIAL